uniref:Putative odorant binding protein 47 n=1 Tax=Nasonia vitripennis TaxID=7425 RepID=G8B1Q2_NASVI|nr:putative odorant binding protein 47 [Nasonia vitripennis]
MKSFLIIQLICLSGLLRAVNAESVTTCLVKNGIKSIDTATFEEVVKTNGDALKTVDKQVACVIACAFDDFTQKKESIYNYLTRIIKKDLDDEYSASERKEMLDILNYCNGLAFGNDCKFLHCINVTKAPFADLILTVGIEDSGKGEDQKMFM